MALIYQVLQAQAAAEGQLLAKQNVVGVAIGFKETEGIITDTLALIALVQAKKPTAQLAESDLIPRRIDGVKTDVYEVGELWALGSLPPLGDLPTATAQANSAQQRYRPTIPPGVSMGHYQITAGTFGAVVRDRTTGERLLLSNNHVFANSNDAAPGDSILQPSKLDGGVHPTDMVARLERFIPLRYIEDANTPPGPAPIPAPNPDASGCNPVGIAVGVANLIATLTGSKSRVQLTPASAAAMSATQVSANIGTGQVVTVAQALTPDNALDAALAKPTNPQMIEDAIRGIGYVGGSKAPSLGMTVRKSGRTTEVTQGRITLLNATINISYNTARGARTARFTGQVLTEAISQGGDSGSLVVDAADNKAVGLLFAGSAVATVFTPIDVVLAALNVTI